MQLKCSIGILLAIHFYALKAERALYADSVSGSRGRRPLAGVRLGGAVLLAHGQPAARALEGEEVLLPAAGSIAVSAYVSKLHIGSTIRIA